MTYAQPVEEHERELSSMPADETRWRYDIDWALVGFWLTYLAILALSTYLGVGG